MPKSTARSRLVAALVQDILQSPEEELIALPSEYQLCERFSVSRVTVRLALTDLENMGLVYRRHGKGTFAFGRSRRLMKPTAVFMRPSTGFQSVGVAELLEGFQQVLSSHRSHMVMIDRAQDAVGHHRPAPFGGVLVIPSGVTAEDYKLLSDAGVRYMTAWETELPVEARKFHLGLEEGSFQSARRLFSAGHKKVGLLGKEAPELQERKMAGVKRACAEAGLEAAALVEGTAAELLGTEGLTAIIALNDRLAESAMLAAAKMGIAIPKKVSLVSLQRWAMCNGASAVSSVDYHLVEAGRAAGERLLAETPEAGVVAEGRGFSLVAGETIAPAS